MARAEELLRTITGITTASIVAHPSGGIAIVRVQTNDDVSRGQVIRNIRSALYAGLGIAVSSECIDFIDDADATELPVSTPAQPPIPIKLADAARESSIRSGGSFTAHRPDAVQITTSEPTIAASLRTASIGNSNAAIAAVASAALTQTLRAPRILHVMAEEELEQKAMAEAVSAAAQQASAGNVVREIVASAAALKLESVEVRRQAGRLRCRVVISLGSDHFGAVADSSDPAIGEVHLAGRVACDALRAGGFTGARFDGAAVAQINGRQHVVVALSEWMSGETIVLSGAAPLEGLPERAAAIAAIKAVLAQDIN